MIIDMIKGVFTWKIYEVSYALKFLYSIDYIIIFSSVILYILMILFEVIRKKRLEQIVKSLDIKAKICMHILILFGLINRAYFQVQSVQKISFSIEDYIPVIYNLIFVSIRYGIVLYIIWIIFKIVKYILIKTSNESALHLIA